VPRLRACEEIRLRRDFRRSQVFLAQQLAPLALEAVAEPAAPDSFTASEAPGRAAVLIARIPIAR